MNNINKHKPKDQNFSIFDIFILVAKNINILILTAFISFVGSMLYVQFFAAELYLSQSKFFSKNARKNSSSASGLAAQFGIDLGTDEDNIKWDYSQLIMSRTMAKKILNKKYKVDPKEKEKSLLEILAPSSVKGEDNSNILESLVIEKIRKMIMVANDAKTQSVTLSVFSPQPALSAQINQSIMDELVLFEDNFAKKSTYKTKIFIQDRISSTEKELMDAEEDLKIFRDRNRRIENSPKLQLEQERLMREVAVLTGVFTNLKQQLENIKIKEVKENDYIIVIDEPNIPITRFKPNKKMIIFLITSLGIALSILFFIVKDYLAKIPKINKDKFLFAISIFKNKLISPFHRFQKN